MTVKKTILWQNRFKENEMEPVPEKFWMVYCLSGHAPTKRHETEASAENEAQRLACANPDKYYCVLGSVSTHWSIPMLCVKRT